MLTALLIPLALAITVYTVTLLRAAVARRSAPRLEAIALGAITNFFDTLGVGSFAPTMAWFKFRRLVPDRLIPCTMLVGHTLPSVVGRCPLLAESRHQLRNERRRHSTVRPLQF